VVAGSMEFAGELAKLSSLILATDKPWNWSGHSTIQQNWHRSIQYNAMLLHILQLDWLTTKFVWFCYLWFNYFKQPSDRSLRIYPIHWLCFCSSLCLPCF